MKFKKQKLDVLINKLEKLRTRRSEEITGWHYQPTEYWDFKQVPAETPDWTEHTREHRFEGADTHYWLHKTFRTPKQTDENTTLLLRAITGKDGDWDARNPQMMVYENGKLIRAFDINHTWMPLEYDKEYDLSVYFYLGMAEQMVDVNFYLEWRDDAVNGLYYDLLVPFDAANCFLENEENAILPIKVMTEAVNHLDLRQPYSEAFYEGVAKTKAYMDKEYYAVLCGKSEAEVACVGHTHIDVAWLWQTRQTVEKAHRSFSTVLNLMREYPEYIFMSSQPQLYQYIKKNDPVLYEEIKERIREGRWEAEGAMWLEADCNLSSGESLVRQVLFGKRFMKQEFGVDNRVLWLPDVFGYSAALPQILKKSGVDRFVTSKISWNEFNQMPYDTFMWQGLDGTEIFSYFLTAQDAEPGQREAKVYTTYVANTEPKQILGTWKRYQQKAHNNEVITTYGHGDGGGGTTPEMIEKLRRLSYGLPGIPKATPSTSLAFLNRVEKRFLEAKEKGLPIPKWVGELYLEFHRGTYTSIAKNKKNNRKCEQLYQLTEKLSAAGMTLLDKAYPQEELNTGWENILLNQFHDILPGSSIHEVYEDTDREYAHDFEIAGGIRDDMLSALAAEVETDGGIMVYNPHSFAAGGSVEHGDTVINVPEIPAMGWKVVKPEAAEGSITVTANTIENSCYRVTFDEQGNICSLYDKEFEREVVKEGETIRFCAYEDYPIHHDAWDIAVYYDEKPYPLDSPVSMTPVQEGARAGIKIVRSFSLSEITQTVYLYENSRRIDFVNHVDWHEDHVLLKALFPTDILTDKATYEVQFGHVERPSHRNTSWDRAKFEVCAQKWADVSENGYGVALLNDCKYGHSANGAELTLSLLKSSTYPDTEADRGEHDFTFSLLPHGGSIYESGVIEEAYLLNQPMLTAEVPAQKGSLPECYSFVSCDSDNIIIETAKKAEDSDDIILRLYDAKNRRCNATLSFGFEVAGAELCDMMENPLEVLTVEDNTVTLPVKNFEIVTLKIKKA